MAQSRKNTLKEDKRILYAFIVEARGDVSGFETIEVDQVADDLASASAALTKMTSHPSFNAAAIKSTSPLDRLDTDASDLPFGKEDDKGMRSDKLILYGHINAALSALYDMEDNNKAVVVDAIRKNLSAARHDLAKLSARRSFIKKVKKEKDSLEAYQHKEYKANKKIPVGFPHQGEERSPKEVASEMARNIREQEEYEQGYHPSGYGYGGSR